MNAMDVWPGPPPGTEHWTHARTAYLDAESGDARVRNVSTPTLTPFLPDEAVAAGTAVVIAPGGGFDFLSIDHEGTEVCEWLASRGVAAFLLEYRLHDTGASPEEFDRFRTDQQVRQTAGKDLAEIMRVGLEVEQVLRLMPDDRRFAYADGAQAVRLVRERADEWEISPNHIGFLGFSAGAFVATAAAVDHDADARPDFVAAIYGGEAPDELPADVPPLFCVVAADDWGLLDACLQTTQAWRASGLSAELHLYAQGGHGFGMKKLGLPVDSWPHRFADWMQFLGHLS